MKKFSKIAAAAAVAFAGLAAHAELASDDPKAPSATNFELLAALGGQSKSGFLRMWQSTLQSCKGVHSQEVESFSAGVKSTVADKLSAEIKRAGIDYKYSDENFKIDPKDPDVRDSLIIYELAVKLMIRNEMGFECTSDAMNSAFESAKSEVAGLKSCTAQVFNMLPFVANLTCDGQQFYAESQQ